MDKNEAEKELSKIIGGYFHNKMARILEEKRERNKKKACSSTSPLNASSEGES